MDACRNLSLKHSHQVVDVVTCSALVCFSSTLLCIKPSNGITQGVQMPCLTQCIPRAVHGRQKHCRTSLFQVNAGSMEAERYGWQMRADALTGKLLCSSVACCCCWGFNRMSGLGAVEAKPETCMRPHSMCQGPATLALAQCIDA